METKSQIRKEILSARNEISAYNHACFSKRITNQVCEMLSYQIAEQILLFASYGSEVDTFQLLEKAIADGKKVFCPRVTGDDMVFYQIDGKDDLFAGYKGILEPLAQESRCYSQLPEDLMLMPGAAFDRKRNRIGYGKGFYDRFLAAGFAGTTAALAFSVQIVENGRIPAEPTDIRPDCIVTEREIICRETQ
jgi:5-formyltetrahydrofolate cyclo-ligase